MNGRIAVIFLVLVFLSQTVRAVPTVFSLKKSDFASDNCFYILYNVRAGRNCGKGLPENLHKEKNYHDRELFYYDPKKEMVVLRMLYC